MAWARLQQEAQAGAANICVLNSAFHHGLVGCMFPPTGRCKVCAIPCLATMQLPAIHAMRQHAHGYGSGHGVLPLKDARKTQGCAQSLCWHRTLGICAEMATTGARVTARWGMLCWPQCSVHMISLHTLAKTGAAPHYNILSAYHHFTDEFRFCTYTLQVRM